MSETAPESYVMNDRLASLTAGLGTPRDKAATLSYSAPTMTIEQALNAYRGSWLPRKIVDVPALDATRRWRNWQAPREEITALEAEEGRHNVRGKVKDALIAARLFGAADLYIGTGDPRPWEPLQPERIAKGGLKHLTLFGPRQMLAGEIEDDIASELFGKPRDYSMTTKDGATVRIHPSRLVSFIGAPLPDDGYGSLSFQRGDSILMAILDAIMRAEGTDANVASLVFEAKVDVISIPDFMLNLADPRYVQQVLTRAGLAVMAKGINGTLLLDSSETYEQKSANFSTLPEIMDRFYQAVSGAADIPMTRLFGQSPAGMNATGQSDLINYYDRIQSMQQVEVQPAMWALDECVIRSALGTRPPELHYTWMSLWQTTDRERAEIGKITAEMVKTLDDAKLFPSETLSRAAANAMIEGGLLPGLEAAIDEFGDIPEDEDPAELAVAMIQPQPIAPNTEGDDE